MCDHIKGSDVGCSKEGSSNVKGGRMSLILPLKRGSIFEKG